MNCVAVMACCCGLALMTGCGPESTVGEGRVIEHDPVLAPEVLDALKRVGDIQSHSRTGAAVIVRRAYDDVSAPTLPKPDFKTIAIDVEFQIPAGAVKGLDLDLTAIELLDGKSETHYGHGAKVQRLTENGEPAANDDPVFAGKQSYRCLLMYEVPKSTESIRLSYLGEMLTPRPATLAKGCPKIPHERVEALALSKLPEQKGNGQDRYLVLLATFNASRVDSPFGSSLRCLSREGAVPANLAGYVEVDDKYQVVTKRLSSRPFFAEKRLFLAEYRCPLGANVLDLKWHDKPESLPVPGELELPHSTLAELAAAALRRTRLPDTIEQGSTPAVVP
jgi:hypothetical protein